MSGPDFFNQGESYKVTVACTGFRARSPVTLEIAVRNSDKSQKLVQVARNVTLARTGSQVVEIDVSSLLRKYFPATKFSFFTD